MKDPVLNFNKIGNPCNGFLISVESNQNIPFEIKRMYYIFGNEQNIRRGFHAHKNLKQVVIVMAGSCTFLLDDGTTKKEVYLDTPDRGLLIEGVIWREMYNFSKDCVIVVLASNLYDESDYIRNYDDFIAYVEYEKKIRID